MNNLNNLIGKELSINSLSKKLVNFHFEDISQISNWNEILSDGCFLADSSVFYVKDCIFHFKVVEPHIKDVEEITSTIIEITKIEEF